MAIAPSKLGRFVAREGFSWPTSQSAAPDDYGAADSTLVRRLRETGLVRPEATDGEIAQTFRAARSEHAAHGYSPFNSPHERVRVFLAPYLTPKGREWAEPLTSLELPDGEEDGNRSTGWSIAGSGHATVADRSRVSGEPRSRRTPTALPGAWVALRAQAPGAVRLAYSDPILEVRFGSGARQSHKEHQERDSGNVF
jgi:hypothetical protein